MTNLPLDPFSANVLEELRNTLVDRGAAYSDFAVNTHSMAAMLRAQGFEIPSGAPAFLTMAEVYILGKLSRLAAGDRMHRDSWLDIAGYAIIAAACLDRMNRECGGECDEP